MVRRHVVRALGALGLACSVAVIAQPGAVPAPDPVSAEAAPAPAPQPAPGARLASLAEFQPGMWELKGEGSRVRSLCVTDPDSFVQVHHAGASCRKRVIADSKSGSTVHYQCPGAGWGRTSFKVDSPRHLTIATQGIANNAPFDDALDARRTGECATASAVGAKR